jgi:hypothetical protein
VLNHNRPAAYLVPACSMAEVGLRLSSVTLIERLAKSCSMGIECCI